MKESSFLSEKFIKRVSVIIWVSVFIGWGFCLSSHVCMGGHMAHPPYPFWHYIIDFYWTLAWLIPLALSLKVESRKFKKITFGLSILIFLFVTIILVFFYIGEFHTIDGETVDLAMYEELNKPRELMETATLYCKVKCSDAQNDGCSLRSLANFCLAYGSEKIIAPDFLDLNNNQVMDYDTTKLAGIGMCEDAVPCHSLVSDCCGMPWSGESCNSILKQYWSSQGNTDEQINCLVKDNIKKGTCTPTEGTVFWYDQAGFKDMADLCIEDIN
jgi:hypothetical protein